MILSDAIKHADEVAQGCGACAEEHAQLASWLRELLERRLQSRAMTFNIDEMNMLCDRLFELNQMDLRNACLSRTARLWTCLKQD